MATPFSAARAVDPGAGDAGHEPARRDEENVEVRPVGIRLHRPHRRRRRDRAEDPPAPRPIPSRCRAKSRVWRAAPRPTIWSASSPRSTTRPRPTCSGASAAASSRPSRPRSPTSRSTKLAPIRAEMLRLAGDPAYHRWRAGGGSREGAGDRAAEHGCDQGHPRPRAIAGTGARNANKYICACGKPRRTGTGWAYLAPDRSSRHQL